MTSEHDDDLAEHLRWVTASETAQRVRSGELTPRQVVAAALTRIDGAQGRLNAFQRITREQALADADRVAERLAAGEHLPLAGVPVAAKDEVAVAGEVVTKGSRARTSVATEDAASIRLVREAGGVFVGATRTPELCLTPYTESLRGGVTRNPWDTSRTPGGSSGGSAAAVAAGLVPLALAGDGGGSIRGPGAWCGLPGLFVTPGSISTAPDVAPWTGMVSPGGFGRTLGDTAALYDVLLTTAQGLAAAVADDPRPVRVLLTTDRAMDRPLPQGGPLDPAWVQAMQVTAARLRGLGHTVRAGRLRFAAASTKFSVRYTASAADDVAATDHPEWVEPVTRFAARVGSVTRRALPWALDVSVERAAVEASLAGFDVLLTPTMPCPAPPVGERDGVRSLVTVLRASRRVGFLNPWNLLGWPGLTVPTGLDEQGHPVAALLTARPGQERLLLQLGTQLERAHPWVVGAGAPPP
ncbi:MAG: amidase family protein, partial [Actinomycetota bacterium]|nr:amidase family protein [Actinomycetota bacterium]